MEITTDLSDPIGVVRLLSRDKDPANAVNSDDEISELLVLWQGDVYLTAAQAVRLMAGDAAKRAKVQTFASFKIGPGSTLYKALLEYADTLQSQSQSMAIPVVSVGGVLSTSTITILDTEQNPDYAQWRALNYNRHQADHW